MPIGAIIAAAGSIGGALIGASAADDAAQAQAQAAANAQALQAQQFQQLQANQAPYMAAGGNALMALQQGLGLAPGSTGAIGQGALNTPFSQQAFQASPAYQFQLQQGLQSAQNAASRIGGLGGNQLLALQQQGQGLAQLDYQQQLQNYMGVQNQQYNQLADITNLGQNAAAGVGQAGQNYANTAGNLMTGSAAVQGAAGIAGANLMSKGLNQAFSNLGGINYGSLFGNPAAQTISPGEYAGVTGATYGGGMNLMSPTYADMPIVSPTTNIIPGY